MSLMGEMLITSDTEKTVGRRGGTEEFGVRASRLPRDRRGPIETSLQ